QKAHVHCVIVGFRSHDGKDGLPTVHGAESNLNSNSCNRMKDGQETVPPRHRIFDGENVEFAENINAYLVNAPDVFIESRSKALCDVPEIGIGNKPIDGGNYLFSEEEKNEFVKKEPASEKYFRKWYGADEYINGYCRYCLWLGDCSPVELRKMPEAMKRVQAVREFRLASKSAQTQKLADTPTRFHVENMPETEYILIPLHSSENRKYVPIGFMPPNVLCSNAVQIIPNATLYHFGILTSSVHMAWMRAVCGRLEMRYRYSKDIVYNNFPWPSVTSQTHDGKDGLPTVHDTKNYSDSDSCKSMKDGRETVPPSITRTAQAILDARTKYPDCSLADLYDETTMPAELRRAHEANDRAVMKAYGFRADMTEGEIVAELFRMYEKLTS
ncbi:MAG: hypothetical protein PUJ24_09355, partial [Bacteroidales bacterium]|nr:hypothetical protein [Bacteroidales bacterium]